jgi:hypothetical protein
MRTEWSVAVNSNTSVPGSSSGTSIPTYALDIPRSLNFARGGVNQDESRSLDYYRARVSKEISGYFDTEFWNELVLQLSEGEPAVRHAIVALSSLYEASETSQLLQHPSFDDRYKHLMRFAACEYTKAVSALFNRINTNGPRLKVTLVACLVFIWIEFLRNNVDDALTHLQSGVRILYEQQQLPTSCKAVIKQVAHILGRVFIQAALHGSSTVKFEYFDMKDPNPGLGCLHFANLGEARCDIDRKTNRVLRFLRQIESAGFAPLHHGLRPFPDLSSLQCTYQAHINDLEQWKVAFQNLGDRLDFKTLTAEALQALDQLELCYLLISTTLETLFASTPMIFDKYNGTFARMISLGRRILENQILRRATSVFTIPFDNSIQGALFYIAVKCRYLPLRREAVELLQLCPDYEGIWQRASLVAFCNWKIDIEEKGRPRGVPETDPLPENARTYAEKAREVMIDGQSLMAIRFRRGAFNFTRDAGFDEEVVTNLSMRLAGLFGDVGSIVTIPFCRSKRSI